MDFLGGLPTGIDGQQLALIEPLCNILLAEVAPFIQLFQILGQLRKLNAKADLVLECVEFAY